MRQGPENEERWGAWSRLEARLARFFTKERARIYPRLMVGMLLPGYVVSLAIGMFVYGAPVDAAGAIFGADFSAFYWAGHALLHGKIAQLYDLGSEARFLAELVAPANSHGEIHAFISPPYWAIFFVPFALLPYPAAVVAFLMLSCCTLLWVVQRLRTEFPELAEQHSARSWVLLGLGFFPVPFSFLNGQTSMLLLALLVGFFVQLRGERDFRAGFVLGLLAIKPQIALGPLLVLLVMRRWRALLGAAVSASVLLLIAQVWLPDALANFLELVPELPRFLRRSDYPRWGQTSLMGFGTLLLDPISRLAGSVVGYSLVAAGAVSIVYLARQFGTKGAKGEAEERVRSAAWDLRWAACFSLGLIATPHLFSYDLALLLLPLAIVLFRVRGSTPDVDLDGGRLLVAVWGLCVASWCGTYLVSWTQGVLRSLSLPACAPQAVTLAVVWFAYCVAQQAKSEAAAPLERESRVTAAAADAAHGVLNKVTA